MIAAMAGEGEWEGRKDSRVDPTTTSPSTRLDSPAAAIEGVDPAHPALPRRSHLLSAPHARVDSEKAATGRVDQVPHPPLVWIPPAVWRRTARVRVPS